VEVGTVRELATRAGDRTLSLDQAYRKLVATRTPPRKRRVDGHQS